VSEKLQRMIQRGGDAAGHSSVEDAAATLDLVRWWIVNEKPIRGGAAAGSAGTGKSQAGGAK
jgi:RNA exonuclease